MLVTIFVCFISSGLTLMSEAEYVNFLSDEYIGHLNKQNLTWQAGRNFPTDLTLKDVERLFGTPPKLGSLPECPAPEERRVTHEERKDASEIPSEFDARQNFKECSDLISVIPDQGACASSYAFAIPSVASDRLCIASHGSIKRLLSAEYVTACCKMCRLSAALCTTGTSSGAWAWIHKRGLVTGGGYNSNIGCQPSSFPSCNHSPVANDQSSCATLPAPQPKCHTRCTNTLYKTGFFQDKNKFKKYYWLSEKVSDIQMEIMSHGPVVGNIYIYSDLLNYKSGVYVVSKDANILTYASVKIIGWGVENSTPYWLVVSTYGANWGLGGTFKIRRGHNEAIIESLVNAALPRQTFEKNGLQEVSDEVEVDSEEVEEPDHDFEFLENSLDV